MSTSKVADGDIILQDHRQITVGDIVHFQYYCKAAIITKVNYDTNVNLWVFPSESHPNYDEYPKIEDSIHYDKNPGFNWHFKEDCNQ